jgi:hypothetical protein
MRTLTFQNLNLFKIIGLVPLSSLFLTLCTSPERQPSIPSTADKAAKSPATSPYLILGNTDTILLDGIPAGTVLASADSWRVLMSDTGEVSIVQLNSNVPATSPLLTGQCQLSTPTGRKIRLVITNYLRAEVQSNSTLTFTPARVPGIPLRNVLHVDGDAILYLLGSYLLNSKTYFLMGPSSEYPPNIFIISDSKTGVTHYLKNIGFGPITLTKPKSYTLSKQHELDQQGKDVPLQGEDLRRFDERFPGLDPFYQFTSRTYMDIVQQFVTSYGLKGYKFIDGVQRNDLQVRMTGSISRMRGLDDLLANLSPSHLRFGLEHDSIVIGRPVVHPGPDSVSTHGRP